MVVCVVLVRQAVSCVLAFEVAVVPWVEFSLVVPVVSVWLLYPWVRLVLVAGLVSDEWIVSVEVVVLCVV